MSILELNDITFRYAGTPAGKYVLNHINCKFEQGKVYAIVGKSGSGKSTLLSLMAGLSLPVEGNLLFEGTPTSAMDLDKYRREHAAVIYQNYKLFPLLTKIGRAHV